jgi:hypothetical protein
MSPGKIKETDFESIEEILTKMETQQKSCFLLVKDSRSIIVELEDRKKVPASYSETRKEDRQVQLQTNYCQQRHD